MAYDEESFLQGLVAGRSMNGVTVIAGASPPPSGVGYVLRIYDYGEDQRDILFVSLTKEG